MLGRREATLRKEIQINMGPAAGSNPGPYHSLGQVVSQIPYLLRGAGSRELTVDSSF